VDYFLLTLRLRDLLVLLIGSTLHYSFRVLPMETFCKVVLYSGKLYMKSLDYDTYFLVIGDILWIYLAYGDFDSRSSYTIDVDINPLNSL